MTQQRIQIIGLMVALLACIAGYLALPQMQRLLFPQPTQTQVLVIVTNSAHPTDTPYPTQIVFQPTYTLSATSTSLPTPIADRLPGTVLSTGDSWISNGVSLTLERVEWKDSPAWIGIVDFWLYINNNSDQEILISFDEHNFNVRDNIDKIYLPKCLYQAPYSDVIPSGEGRYIADSCTPYDSTMFTGDFFNQSAKQLTLTVKNLSRIQEAQWIVDVPH
jgi:hypothetical protein